MKPKLNQSLQRHKAERKNILLDSAAQVIVTKGIRSTTMDNISASLGMTKIILYRTFGSRDKLIHSILERITQHLLDEDALEVEHWGDRIYGTMTIARQHTDSVKILFLQTPNDQDYHQHFKKLHNILVNRTLNRLEKKWGGSDTKPVNLIFFSESIVAFILDSIARWLKDGKESDDKEFVKWIILSITAMSDKWSEIYS